MSWSDPVHRIFTFDDPPPLGPDELRRLLGGKAAGLVRMKALGLPVPPGFVLPTSVCTDVLASGWSADLDATIAAGIGRLEAAVGRRLGAGDRPLLVSVRSGAPVSMPGMMDTVLNAGMTPAAAEALSRGSGDARFGWDTYRRFIESYSGVVSGATPADQRAALAAVGVEGALPDVGIDELPGALSAWRQALADAGHRIPEDPVAQVIGAVQAVFRSWQSQRAEIYRRAEGIADDLGTAATVQAMVYGNQSDRSGTGVAFSRDPSTGTAGLVGDFLVRAQGEDVVAGTHATEPLSALAGRWPDLGARLEEIVGVLEREIGDLVDVEFTIEHGVLWLLQARVGKRSPRAALRMAVAMAEDPAFPLDRAAAVARVEHLLDDPPTDVPDGPDGDADILTAGSGASPGRAVGIVCTEPDEAVRLEAAGTDVILVRPETSPADIHGMAAARGLVTTLGGLMSHAAVVARSWGVPAVVGAADVSIQPDAILIADRRVPAGEVVTVDGDRGLLLLGSHPGQGPTLPEVGTLRAWRAQLGEKAGSDERPAGADTAVADTVGATADAGGALSAEDCRRALVLKGMAGADGIAAFARVGVEAAAAALAALVEAGEAKVGPGDRFMMTPEGTAAADAAYRAEAVGAAPAIEPHLDAFHSLNLRFKEVVTDWQMKEVDGERVMNDHDDADYDATVLSALAGEVHDGIVAVIAELSAAVPRLAVYRDRLQDAVAAIEAGDSTMVASPMKESYHTVWFELHEELIRLSGRNRADEAAAGRA